ncbi:electron transfer flavoprotein subunit alpha/FixB family protein [Vibrio algarum]|uniref:FAD-binding protein n=1 Tax=Vibrio algarum TaxID=3020714 RepID=A0ABT4YUT3_9VIBR|nr:FAD-binding protein [Vibrio sp. KJ40-1]MDB1125215.1 FAD-binding protein [Vibrio sp. KJ40-1]
MKVLIVTADGCELSCLQTTAFLSMFDENTKPIETTVFQLGYSSEARVQSWVPQHLNLQCIYTLDADPVLNASSIADSVKALTNKNGYDLVAFVCGAVSEQLAVRSSARIGGNIALQIQSVIPTPQGWKTEQSAYANQMVLTSDFSAKALCITVVPAVDNKLKTYLTDSELIAYSMDSKCHNQDDTQGSIRLLSKKSNNKSSALLESDKVVVYGRGAGGADKIADLVSLASEIGMEVGASRAAVSNGWFTTDQQVGVSGNSLSAKLVVVAGISGTGAFMHGIKDTGYIVAINSDPNAAVFRCADVGIIGSLHEVLPLLKAKIESDIFT